jgi:CubicO group peptidase (beta-lactamase class C family)
MRSIKALRSGWKLGLPFAATLICLVGFSASARAQPRMIQAGEVDTDRAARIGQAIQRHVDAHHIAGAVGAVTIDGQQAYFGAHGLAEVEGERPMEADSLFRMASVSKFVTAAAILMLVDEGKVSLNDPLSKFIPEFANLQVAESKDGKRELVPAMRPITIRDVLTHTSGLMCGLPVLDPPDCPPLPPVKDGETLASYMQTLSQAALLFQPGTRWHYSGLPGFDALARVVEVASGQPYSEFLQERLFDPLGMVDTTFTPSDAQRARLATIYRSENGQLLRVEGGIRFPASYDSGAAGLFSTAADIQRFGQMLCNYGRVDDRQLLSRRIVELMGQNYVGELFAGQLGRPMGMGFGLGVETITDPTKALTLRYPGSFGWDGAFGTYLWVDPEHRLVAVLMMQHPAGLNSRMVQTDFDTALMQAIR